jgi:hypothetical protein
VIVLKDITSGALPGSASSPSSQTINGSQSNVIFNEIGQDLLVKGLIISEPAGYIASKPLTSIINKNKFGQIK